MTGLQLEEELPDAPALRPRLKRDVQVGLANAGTGHETERRLKLVADLLPIQRHVPAIVRIVEREATRAGAASASRRRCRGDTGRAKDSCCRETSTWRIARRRRSTCCAGAGRVAVRHDAANPRLLENVAADASSERFCRSTKPPVVQDHSRAGLDVEHADVVVGLRPVSLTPSRTAPSGSP